MAVKQLCVYVSRDEFVQLTALARLRGVSVSALCKGLIDQALDPLGADKLAAVGRRVAFSAIGIDLLLKKQDPELRKEVVSAWTKRVAAEGLSDEA